MNPYYNKSVGGKGTGSGKDHPMFGRSGENSPMIGKKRSDTAARNKKMRGEKNHMFGIDSKDHPMFGKKHKQELTSTTNPPLQRLIIIPLTSIASTLFLITFIGEAIREAFDPKIYSRLR